MLAIFDADGTLFDSGGDLADAINATRRSLGLTPKPEDEIISYIGDGIGKLVSRSIPELPLPLEQLVKMQVENYRACYLNRTRLYPQVAETLTRLRDGGWLMAVATNKNRDLAEQILAGLGIAEFFGAVVGGGDCERNKPHSDPLLLAAQKCGTVLSRADWMVGDNHTDLAAGAAAGVSCCFCTFGLGHPGGLRYDAAIDSFGQLAELLTGRNG